MYCTNVSQPRAASADPKVSPTVGDTRYQCLIGVEGCWSFGERPAVSDRYSYSWVAEVEQVPIGSMAPETAPADQRETSAVLHQRRATCDRSYLRQPSSSKRRVRRGS